MESTPGDSFENPHSWRWEKEVDMQTLGVCHRCNAPFTDPQRPRGGRQWQSTPSHGAAPHGVASHGITCTKHELWEGKGGFGTFPLFRLTREMCSTTGRPRTGCRKPTFKARTKSAFWNEIRQKTDPCLSKAQRSIGGGGGGGGWVLHLKNWYKIKRLRF